MLITVPFISNNIPYYAKELERGKSSDFFMKQWTNLICLLHCAS